MSRSFVVAALIAALIAGCSASGDPTSTTADPVASVTTTTEPATTTTFGPGIADAEAYLMDSIAVIESNALLADRIDWETRRADARALAAEASGASQLHSFIKQILRDLGDGHWWFATASQMAEWAPPSETEVAEMLPFAEREDDRIGHIVLGSWPVTWSEVAPQYTQAAYEAMAEAESDGVCGWIVDLRTNGGGYGLPMLASVVPFITERAHDTDNPLHLGVWTDVAGDEYAATYTGDRVAIESFGSMTLIEPLLLDDPHAPVAVLVSSSTASFGEMTMSVFDGRTDTRVFGFSTAGQPAGTDFYFLEDGAGMAFAVLQFTDRQGTQYEPDQPLQPDETAGGTRPAIDWILNHPSCNNN